MKQPARRSVSRSLVALAGAAGMVLAVSGTASANHSWGGYHWARSTSPFTLQLGNDLSADWQAHLSKTSSDWSVSTVLDTTVVSGRANPKTCKPTLGRVEVCNAKYGQNGWLGLAQIWADGSLHITQGTAKMNDSYFSLSRYNTLAEKNHVMCQEVGHTFGLGHQSETGDALGTCMDYSMDAGSQQPNTHDYQQLESIYAQLDSTTTVGSATATSGTLAERDQNDHNANSNWGRRVFRSGNGKAEIYEKAFQDGSRLVSFVILAEPVR